MFHIKNITQIIKLTPFLNVEKIRMRIKNRSNAFTLVELIVVIVILSILSTIAFLSFSSYSSSSRDSVRLGDITSIAKGLTLQYSIGGSYIIPDNSVSLLSGSTTIIGYQGKAGYNTLNSIKLSTSNNNSGKDPLDNTYYTYNINSNKNKYQLSGFLENKGTIINRTSSINNTIENEKGKIENTIVENGKYKIENNGISDLIPHLTPAYRQAGPSRLGEELSSLPLTKGELEGVFQINQTYATTYTNRYPYTKGDSIGVILSYTGNTTGNTTNSIYTPIEDNISTSTGIDISSGTLTSGKIVISNNVDSSTGVSVSTLSGYITVNISSSDNGTCGTTNGTIVSSTPSTNLCTSGTPGSVLYNTGMGQYNWTCGSSTSCKAYDNYNVLLMHFDGNFNNSGSLVASMSNYGSPDYNYIGRFGSGVNFSAGSYLQIPSTSTLNTSGIDFTIDGWIRFNNIAKTQQGIFGRGDLNWVSLGFNEYSDYKMRLRLGNGGWIVNGQPGSKTNWVNNQRYHFALIKIGSNYYVYIDGVLDISYTTSAVNDPSLTFAMGTSNNYAYYFAGVLDEFRFSKGIARWTGPFTPPTVPY